MTLQWSVRLLILALLLATLPAPCADALPIRIEFIEGPGDVAVTLKDAATGMDLPRCDGQPFPCLRFPGIVRSPEGASFGVTMPAGTAVFAGVRAALVEPGVEPAPGATSDIARLRIQFEPPDPNPILRVQFSSDREGRELPGAPAGFGVAEDGTLQCLGGCPDGTEKFFRGTPPMFVPLPAGVVNVSVQSDVVPEPTTLLLFGTTMAGLGLAARWRRRRQG
jgi:hypothetical protein